MPRYPGCNLNLSVQSGFSFPAAKAERIGHARKGVTVRVVRGDAEPVPTFAVTGCTSHIADAKVSIRIGSRSAT